MFPNISLFIQMLFLYTLAMFLNYVKIFFISMLPLVELRGAIPFSQAYHLPIIPSYIISILGNMVPVPIIYLFARRFLEWGKDKKVIGKICAFFLEKGTKAGLSLQKKAGRSLFLALALFVAIPIPGTGAWTGTLAASLLDMDFKDTTLAVTVGVLIAGIIMMLASLGAFSAIAAFFAK